MSFLLFLFLSICQAQDFPSSQKIFPVRPSVPSAQSQEKVLDSAVRTIAAQFQENPDDLKKIFHSSFLKEVPENTIRGLFKDYHAKYGAVKSFTTLKSSTYEGEFLFSFEKGFKVKVEIVVFKKEPHLITGFMIQIPSPDFKNFNELILELKKLPGTVNFQLAKLGGAPEVLAQLNPDKALAIGSTCKLYILGSLILEGKSWRDIVALRKEHMSLPSGDLHKWPEGSPVSVHTLAGKMISESDNTATDHLLHYAGRETIEKHLKTMGHRNPALMMPFLTTMEMFQVKSDENLISQYEKADLEGKRKLLAGAIAAVPRDQVGGMYEPTAIETIEWFASASDLVNLMDWMRRQNNETALRIMAISPGLDFSKEVFEYVGYKGGSESGVINMTWLLKTKKGIDYALTSSWNNSKEAVDNKKFFELMQSAIYLIEAD